MKKKRQRAGYLQDASRGLVATGKRASVVERGIHAASMSKLQSTSKRPEVRAPNEFTNEEVYAYAHELEKLHPANRHIREKIRQQLQVQRTRPVSTIQQFN